MLADLALPTRRGRAPLRVQDAAGTCVAPAVSTLADRTYPLARTDYLYINAESAARPEVQAFVEFALTGEDGVTAQGPVLGYTPADAATYETGLANLLAGKTGRTFSRPINPVQVDAATEGTVTVTGTAMLYDITRRIDGAFKTQYTGATIEAEYAGNAAGWDAFCAGEADVLRATRAATENACPMRGERHRAVHARSGAAGAGDRCSGERGLDRVRGRGHGGGAAARAGTEDAPAAATWQEINAERRVCCCSSRRPPAQARPIPWSPA